MWLDVVGVYHYYPYGKLIENRTWEATESRFGFQGQERDDEIAGAGNSLSTFYRLNRSDITIWLTLDPKMDLFPGRSTYTLYGNNPINRIDPRGDLDGSGWGYYNAGIMTTKGDTEAIDRYAGAYAKHAADAIDGVTFFISNLDFDDEALGFSINNFLKTEGSYWDNPNFENHLRFWGGGLEVIGAFGAATHYSRAARSLLHTPRRISTVPKIERILVQKNGSWKKLTELPIQNHHFLTKYGEWGKRFKNILKKYDLNIDGDWNKWKMHHSGPHPKDYHQDMFNRLKNIDAEAKGDKDKFLDLFDTNIKQYVQDNPEIIHHNYQVLED